MANTYFQFKQFTIHQDKCAMKVSTEACILGAWVKSNNPKRILDVGTGTGLLALMLAQRFDGPIDAVELDEATASQALQNVANSPWSDRITVIQKDVFEFGKGTNYEYDLIISNPPFFRSSLKSITDKNNLAKHEGNFFDKIKFIDLLKAVLSSEGLAFILYPEEEAMAFTKLAIDQGLFVLNALVIKNRPKKDMFRVVIAVSKQKRVLEKQELTIREGDSHSSDYISLLQDFYL